MPPAVIAAGIGVAGAIGGAAISSSAAKRAGQTQAASADRSAQIQQQTAREGMALSAQQFGQTRADVQAQYGQTRADLAPWRTQGAQASGVYGGYLGLNQPAPQATGGGVQTAQYGDVLPFQENITPTRQLAERRYNPRANPLSRYSEITGNNQLDQDRFGEDFAMGGRGGRRGFSENMGMLPPPVQTARPTTTTGALQGDVLPPLAAMQAQAGPQSQAGAPGQAQAAPMDFRTALELSPQYQFLREEGMRGIENRAAARGSLQSGGTLKALSKYNQNLAYGMSEGYLNRLAGVSGQGLTAASQTGAFGAQASGQIGAYGAQATGQQAGMLGNLGRGMGSAYTQAGAATAAGQIGSANAWGQAIQGVGNTLGGYLGYSAPGGAASGYDPVVQEQLAIWG